MPSSPRSAAGDAHGTRPAPARADVGEQRDPASFRSGRRAGTTTTKHAIGDAAREQFAEKGFGGTSIRAIARQAEVDPALIGYFFGSKAELFAQVLELPFEPSSVIPTILGGDRADVGTRLADFVIATMLATEPRQRLAALLRSASGDNDAAKIIREKVTSDILTPVAEALGVEDAALRAGLAMSQIVGLVMALHVIGLDALRQADTTVLRAALAPTLQRYLAGDIRGRHETPDA